MIATFRQEKNLIFLDLAGGGGLTIESPNYGV